ncbi:MAG: amino acid ABC transporter permease [Clostridia bacterium]|nr:amino acid ABC transporter permease [Clostridia bacterium]
MFDDLPGQLYAALIKEDRWKLYIEGLGNTMIIAIGAVVIGLVLGTVIALIKVNANLNKKNVFLKFLDVICDIYLTVIRGTPMMVQILIGFNIIFAALSFDYSVLVAIICFGINSGAYVAEIVRSGIQAVNRGQLEAGRSLGLSNSQTMSLIILPQAIKNILPALGNELIVLFKETAIVGYIAVQDLTKMATLIQSRTYQPFVPLILSALIYLSIVMLMSWGLRGLERRLNKSDRR